MSSRLVNEDYLKYVRESEDDIVSQLSNVNVEEFSRRLSQKAFISYSVLNSFDVENIDERLLVRYLLRMALEKLKSEILSRDDLFQVLSSVGGNTAKLISILREWGSQSAYDDDKKIGDSITGVGETSDTEQDVTFNADDANLLSESLVTAGHKWELIGTSLGLKEHEIADCNSGSSKVSLCRVIKTWLSNHSCTTLKKLKTTLSSGLVGETNLSLSTENKVKAAKIEKKFVEDKKSSKKLSFIGNPIITSVSNTSMQVAEGKSTLLFVQACPRECLSYQWKKDGKELEESSVYVGVHSDILEVRQAHVGTEGEYTCCVTSKGKQVCCESIVLTVLYPLGKKKLLDYYLSKKEVPNSRHSWPPVVSKEFINLALIDFSEDLKYCYNYSFSGTNVDSIKAHKEKIEYEDAFKEYKSSELIMIEGRPGSGKTTLIHKITKDWAHGKALIGAKLVFMVVLRELNKKKINSIQDLLEVFYFEDELKAVLKHVIDSNGDKIAFVIDGLDEYYSQDKENDLIFQLLDNKLLPLAMIVVSSRPSASESVREDVLSRRIEIVGFSENEIMEYIDCFPFSKSSSKCRSTTSSQSAQDSLKDYLHSHPNVMDMCYLPVHSAMICYLYDSESVSRLSTQTSIYEEFIRSLILRHIRTKNSAASLKSLHHLSKECRKYFNKICKLAFNMTIDSKQIITAEHLASYIGSGNILDDSNCLGLLIVHNQVQYTGRTRTFSFLHLTLQEFLSAHYINHLRPAKQVRIFKEHSDSDFMETVWNFYCGLTSFRPRRKKFKGVFVKEDYTQQEQRRKRLVRYALESQQQMVWDKVAKTLDGKFIFFSNELTPTDLLAIGHVMCKTTQPVTVLCIGELNNDDSRINILLEKLCQKHLVQLKRLSINTTIQTTGIESLIVILKCARNLRSLEFKIENISAAQTESLIDLLKHLKTLEMFHLTLSSTSTSSIHALTKNLSNLPSKLYLYFTFVDMHIEGIQALSSGLALCVHKNIRGLTFSGLDSSSVPPGCDFISSADSTNGDKILTKGSNTFGLEDETSPSTSCLYHNSLSHLNLSRNNLGSEAAGILSSSFQCLTELQQLDLSHNNIGFNGATSLASSLKYLTELKQLKLSGNNLGVEGTATLSPSFFDLTMLQQLDLSHNNIGVKGATSFSLSCEHLCTLDVIDLSHNNIGTEGAKPLSFSFKHLTKLRQANFSHNNIGCKGAQYLSRLFQFQHFAELRHLDISYNSIGCEGANSLSQSLPHLTELRHLDISHNDISSDNILPLATKLPFLANLQYLNISHNDIDLEGAKLILTHLKECSELSTAVITTSEEVGDYEHFVVHGLVTSDDIDDIQELIKAVQHKKKERILDLGFTVIDIAPKLLWFRLF